MKFNIKAIANKRTTTQRLEAMSLASFYLGCAAFISLPEPLVQGGRKRCNPFVFGQKLQHPLFQMGNNSAKIMRIKLRETGRHKQHMISSKEMLVLTFYDAANKEF